MRETVSSADRRTRTRRALAGAVRRLATAGDIDAVTVESIVEVAGTSRTTFFRYFPSKYDALLYHFDEGSAVLLREAARLVPAGPVWSALRTATVASLRDILTCPEPMRELAALVHAHPNLNAAALRREDATCRALADLLAGTNATEDAHLLARAVFAARSAATACWLADPDADLVRLTIANFDRLDPALAQ